MNFENDSFDTLVVDIIKRRVYDGFSFIKLILGMVMNARPE